MRKMKDSGIEWIGEIPEEWRITTIGKLFLAKAGGDAKVDLYSDEKDEDHPYPVYTNAFDENQVYAYTSLPVFPKNSITVTGRGDIGHAIFRKTEFDAIIRLNVLTSKFNLCEKYFVYFIDTVIPFFTNSAAVGQLSATQITSYNICFPSFPEQHKIAAFLDHKCSEIDSVIEKTKATIEEYKSLKQSVITQAVTKGIRKGGKMKDSGIEWIGEICSDFQIRKLKYVFIILDQFRSPITADKRNQNSDVLYDYYGASGVIDKIDSYTIDDHVMLIGEDGANLKMRNLPLMYEINGKAWVNNHAHILKPNSGYDFRFLFYALESLDINTYITGSAQPKLSQENLKNILIPIPTYDEQKEIATYLDEKCAAINTLIAKKVQLLTELESYKKSVIFEYVTGKKEVR